MPMPLEISHHTTCLELIDDDDDEMGTTSRGGEWSSDHVLELIIMVDVEIPKHLEADGSDRTDEDGEGKMNDEDTEDWEAELDDGLEDSTAELKDWTTHHTQIKTHMKKHLKSMPLSQLNQYMILGNFATLCICGIT